MYARSRKILGFAAVAAVTMAFAACDIAVNGDGGLDFDLAAGKAQDTWTRSYPLDRSGRLEIINVNGRITAEASDGTSVEVTAERSAKAGSDDAARDLLKQIEMREEVSGDRVRVEVRAPRMRGSGHEIKWTVRVPRGVAVDLRTVNGAVKLQSLEGEIRARTTNGGIVGSGLVSGSVDAAVTNGGVEIELVKAVSTGTYDLQAVNGGVSLMMPSDSKADFAARCVNGGISVEGLDVQVNGEERTRRRLDGQLNGGGARVSLETVNGGVKILRTPDASAAR